MSNAVAVGYANASLKEEAGILADKLQLALDNALFPQLCLTEDKLVLLLTGFSPLFADFSVKTLQRRRDAGKKQGLVKACKPFPGKRILDATGGWGRDAAILASFGAQVLLIERDPVMAALLADALQRIPPESRLRHSLSLQSLDAKCYLQELSPNAYPDVIYIDPMHPVREKSALVKKEMQALQQILGADEDALALLQTALPRARERVVVKWPHRLEPLMPPDLSFDGKTVRFDVYLTNKKAAGKKTS
ncbi:class I SAM-dependent methyltransferase [Legionella septentrionalis]|uniref:class I SAM-dependent methyltransferase n=1 Tax=Legionella septentrionalis TaxID=2498109 RepID=UPI000F8E1268|nr:class I SAM-dependent methyltransferase [Legionella septentrionalis]RUR00537.1 SAM-dependent methyltransferase [Legionella septentrionalis]